MVKEKQKGSEITVPTFGDETFVLAKSYLSPASNVRSANSFPPEGLSREEYRNHFESLMKRTMVITGAALVLILYFAEDWFMSYLRGERQVSLTESAIISYSDLPRPHQEIGWFDRIACRGHRRSVFCSNNRSE